MNELFEEMLVDAEKFSGVSTSGGATISGLIKDLQALERTIADQEEALKSLKNERRRLAEELIPAKMEEMGVRRIDVEDATLSIKPVVHASIPADRKQEAFDWLRTQGLDDIIKNDIVVSFGKGSDNVATNLFHDLRDRGFDAEAKTHIHPMTLKAFVRERVEDGKPIDLDLFGAYVGKTVDMKRR